METAVRRIEAARLHLETSEEAFGAFSMANAVVKHFPEYPPTLARFYRTTALEILRALKPDEAEIFRGSRRQLGVYVYTTALTDALGA